MGKSLKYWSVSIIIIGLLAGLFLVAIHLQGINPDSVAGRPITAMVAICFGTFVSEDLSTITAGLLAASGVLTYWQSVLAAYVGILAGDMIIFWMGYHFGRPMLAHKWAGIIFPGRAVGRAQKQFHKNGMWIILITRFLPGTRTATYFAAGAVHAPVMPFIAAFALAAFLWTPFLVGLSYLVGKQLVGYYELYEVVVLPALIGAGLILYLVFHYGMPLFTWEGRRRLRGKWMRATQWEFWPTWQVYWLVVLYILWIGIFRYGKPTLFTAVNPGMPDGGVLGESKSDILKDLAAAEDALPNWSIIESGTISDRENQYNRAMQSLNLEYPVVLKPDRGQRGAGVKVIKNYHEAMLWLEQNLTVAILQEYATGQEYGIFYTRKPSSREGTITSITLKQQLFITGNNSNSIETLIHAHPRAIAMLDTFLDRFEDRLDEIPAMGQTIPLGELGTHSRGSLFLDGRHLKTEALLLRVQEIADSCPGFYFGRFDIKAPNDEALKNGTDLKIIELNGVTSEETHIYDPQYGLFQAWKCLCRQWATAFEIAAENARSGHQPTSIFQLIRNLISASRGQV